MLDQIINFAEENFVQIAVIFFVTSYFMKDRFFAMLGMRQKDILLKAFTAAVNRKEKG